MKKMSSFAVTLEIRTDAPIKLLKRKSIWEAYVYDRPNDDYHSITIKSLTVKEGSK